MEDTILSPADFVALLNQTLEIAYPFVIIEGELSNFKVSKNRWVYFDLQDEIASVRFFGTVYVLPGPLEDGLKIRVVGSPRMHPRFGFSVNIQSISPVGAGSIKKAADLLKAKLQAEGLFDLERKRPLPSIPTTIGLITAAGSAAYTDFIKILNERWGGVEVWLADVYVQGAQAPHQIVRAIEYFNEMPKLPDVLVVTRGGGSAEDLASFNDERVVRAVSASRIPTLVAVGHEVDVSLAELAADMRASTPTNSAQVVVPDKKQILSELASLKKSLERGVQEHFLNANRQLIEDKKYLSSQAASFLDSTAGDIKEMRKLASIFDPDAALKRGYAIVSKAGKHISSVRDVKAGDKLSVKMSDGTISTKVEGNAS